MITLLWILALYTLVLAFSIVFRLRTLAAVCISPFAVVCHLIGFVAAMFMIMIIGSVIVGWKSGEARMMHLIRKNT